MRVSDAATVAKRRGWSFRCYVTMIVIFPSLLFDGSDDANGLFMRTTNVQFFHAVLRVRENHSGQPLCQLVHLYHSPVRCRTSSTDAQRELS